MKKCTIPNTPFVGLKKTSYQVFKNEKIEIVTGHTPEKVMRKIY